jgi:hypothetical protein
MARLFTAASSETLQVDTAAITAYPHTFAAWIRVPSPSTTQVIMGVGDKDATGDYSFIYLGASAIRAQSSTSAGGAVTASSSGTVSANVWTHAAGVFTANNSRAAFRDGANKGTNTSARTPAGLDRTVLGSTITSAPGFYFGGDMAEVGIWNVALTDNEIAMLASGVSPLRVHRSALVRYWPLLQYGGDTPDYSGNGGTLTDTNTVGVSTGHAPVAPQFALIDGWRGAFTAAAGAPSSWGPLLGLQSHRLVRSA